MLGSGLVNSLVRPDGNTTGVSLLAPALDHRRQHILIRAVPGLRQMAALVDLSNTAIAKLEALQATVRAHDVELSIHRIATADEILPTVDMAQVLGSRALHVLSSPLLYGNRRLIVDRVAALRLPAVYEWPEAAEEGGFVPSDFASSAFFTGSPPPACPTLPWY